MTSARELVVLRIPLPSRLLFLAVAFAALGFAVLSLWPAGSWTPERPILAVVNVGIASYLFRQAAMGVRLSTDLVTVRNYWRTHRIPLTEVVGFELREGPTISRRIAVKPVVRLADGRLITLESLVPMFRPRKEVIEAALDRLNHALANLRGRLNG